MILFFFLKNIQFASGKGPGGDIKYTQSTAFFKKLQQDAQIEISKSKGDSNKNKKQNKSGEAHGLKL